MLSGALEWSSPSSRMRARTGSTGCVAGLAADSIADGADGLAVAGLSFECIRHPTSKPLIVMKRHSRTTPEGLRDDRIALLSRSLNRIHPFSGHWPGTAKSVACL